MNKESNSTEEKIWLTSKTRKFSEAKHRRRDTTHHLTLFLTTSVLIGLNIFKDEFASRANVDNATTALAVLLLVLSVFLYERKWGESAAQFRECYLQLDSLLNKKLPPDKLNAEYSAILKSYPNHDESDYDSFIITEVALNKKSLHDSTGEPLLPTFKRYFTFFFSQTITYGPLIAAIIGSVAIVKILL